MDIGAQLDAIGLSILAVTSWIVARPFWLLLVLQGFDILTGILVAYKEQRVSSKISREGMLRKVGFLLAVAFAGLVEPLSAVAGGPPIGQATAWMFCGPEVISIGENLKALGVNVPFGRELADYPKGGARARN